RTMPKFVPPMLLFKLRNRPPRSQRPRPSRWPKTPCARPATETHSDADDWNERTWRVVALRCAEPRGSGLCRDRGRAAQKIAQTSRGATIAGRLHLASSWLRRRTRRELVMAQNIEALPEWGPKMRALANDKQRAFVCALFDAPPHGKGQLIWSAKVGGYGTPT